MTWYSRIWRETDRNGNRVAIRDCFESFINPPATAEIVLCGEQATLATGECQAKTTISSGLSGAEHYMSGKYSIFQRVTKYDSKASATMNSAVNPPLSDRISAEFTHGVHRIIRSSGRVFRRTLHKFSACFSTAILFGLSAGFSDDFRPVDCRRLSIKVASAIVLRKTAESDFPRDFRNCTSSVARGTYRPILGSRNDVSAAGLCFARSHYCMRINHLCIYAR